MQAVGTGSRHDFCHRGLEVNAAAVDSRADRSGGEKLEHEKGTITMKLTDLMVARAILAPSDQVFDVWMDAKSPGGPWFGPHKLIFNPIVDGLFYMAVQHEERIWPHYGRFLQIARPSKVEYTWMSEGTKGVESVVLVTFEPRGEHTEVTLCHSGVPDDEMGRQHKDGWSWVLSSLADRFAQK
jgi:uncharacterized protein YndB with AHSA1/START domain